MKKGEHKGHRIAVSVSKKEEKTAVGRNRIKRRLRHAVRIILRDSQSWDIFIVARGSVKTTPWEQLLRVCENSMLKR